MVASFHLNPINTFAQIAYSVELIQPRCVLVDDGPSLTQLLSCPPAEGQLSINCPNMFSGFAQIKEGTNSTCFSSKSAPALVSPVISAYIDHMEVNLNVKSPEKHRTTFAIIFSCLINVSVNWKQAAFNDYFHDWLIGYFLLYFLLPL